MILYVLNTVIFYIENDRTILRYKILLSLNSLELIDCM